MILSVALLGALMNKIRGGLLAALYAKRLVRLYHLPFVEAEQQAENKFKFFGKHIHHLVFALVFTLIISPVTTSQKVDCFLLLSVGMLAGSCMGWGNYINAMIDGTINKNRKDAIIADGIFFGLSGWPVLAGFIALSFRGLMWTSLLGISLILIALCHVIIDFESFLIIPIGLLMGLAYLLAMEICQRIPGMVRGNGWQIGEYFWGFILWGSLAYLIKA